MDKNMTLNQNTAGTSWEFRLEGSQLHFSIEARGSVDLDFASRVLHDAIARKNKAVLSGDGMSLDMLLGALPKKAILNFAETLRRSELPE